MACNSALKQLWFSRDVRRCPYDVQTPSETDISNDILIAGMKFPNDLNAA
jgi:hypothetical protein